MVSQGGRYFGTLLKGHSGITQGDPLSPTIFNVVVDSVICYWVNLVVLEENRMNFASNSVFGKTPKFVYLGLLRAHTADKMKSIFAPATRAVGLVDNSDCLTSKHRIAEHTVDKLSEEKVYSDYI